MLFNPRPERTSLHGTPMRKKFCSEEIAISLSQKKKGEKYG
jgi:hypothetical protein